MPPIFTIFPVAVNEFWAIDLVSKITFNRAIHTISFNALAIVFLNSVAHPFDSENGTHLHFFSEPLFFGQSVSSSIRLRRSSAISAIQAQYSHPPPPWVSTLRTGTPLTAHPYNPNAHPKTTSL